MRPPTVKVYQRGKRWWVSFFWQRERFRWPAGETEREAELLKARIVLAIAERRFRGRMGDVAPDDQQPGTRKRVTVRKLAEKFLDTHAKKKRSEKFYIWTVDAILRTLGKTADLPVDRFTAEHVAEFVAERYKDVEPSTGNRSLRVLKQVLDRAVQWGYIEKNPAAHFKLERENNKREFFLTREQYEDLLARFPGGWAEPTVAFFNTGARRGEILPSSDKPGAGLVWEDVNLKAGTVRLRGTKNGEDRSVPLTDELRAVLTATRGKGFRKGHVFLDPVKKDTEGNPLPLMARRYRDVFERVVQAAELSQEVLRDGKRVTQRFRLHDARHTYASWLVQNGVPLITVRDLLGHKSIDQTERYSHLAPDNLEVAAKVLNAMHGRQSKFDTTSTQRG